MNRKLATALLISLLLATLAPPAVMAAAPANDAFANATVIDPLALPFTDIADNTDASTEPGEPDTCGYPTGHSLWYRFTASSDTIVRFDMNGTFPFNRKVDVFESTGPTMADLSLLGCGGFSEAFFDLHPTVGTTYYVRIADVFNQFGILQLNAAFVLPPVNDDRADATLIGSLPYSNTVDMTAATVEPNEPFPNCTGAWTQTAWYSYEPASSASVSGTLYVHGTVLGVYRETGSGALEPLACGSFAGSLTTVRAEAGTRYFFQVVRTSPFVREVVFELQVAPNPSAQFSYNPFDPSSIDTIQFFGNTFDPANVGISSWAWDFGDGATATAAFPQHSYAADGAYTVRLTVGTPDGRSDTVTQTVQVRTHDVAITKLNVPTSANAGQTRSITVGIANRRYPETVSVSLFRLSPSGPVQVGVLTQAVPVRAGNRTTDFAFSYTFTPDDARIGKVSFQAVATIGGARDAIPGDNQAQSLPTKVNR